MALESFTYREILSQGQAWEATLNTLPAITAETEVRIRKLVESGRRAGEIILTGCGSTHYLAISAAPFWRQVTGLILYALPASELWLHPELVFGGNDTVQSAAGSHFLVAISRSGETTETIRAMELWKEKYGGETLVVTCYPESSLAKATPYKLVTEGAEEQSIAQTRSFTSMFLLLQAAACLACGNEGLLEQLKSVSRSFDHLISGYEGMVKGIAENLLHERFVFLGSGINYGLACEAMLKMKEMSLSPAEAFHFLEFRHGPKSVVDRNTLIVGLMDEAAEAQEKAVLEEMRDLGASILAISFHNKALPVDYQVNLQPGVSYLASRVLTLPLLQLMALYRAVHKGLDPDRPANLDAVVRLK
jgi:glucosamine--fructose-6-phosphate aminotransferase (isomerizing)